MRKSFGFLAVICAFFTMFESVAQSKDIIEIGKVDVNTKLPTPKVVQHRILSNSGGNTYWVAITVPFKINDFPAKKNALDNGKWIDKASIVWKGLFKASDGKYRRIEKTVNYTSLTPGVYNTTILIDPVTIKRYFGDEKNLVKNLSLYGVFKINGRTQMNSKIYIQFGKRQKKFLSPVTERAFSLEELDVVDNILSSKDETPWRDSQADQFPKIVNDK